MILIMEKFKELSLEEKIMVKGGGIGTFLAIAGAVIYCYNNGSDLLKGFKDGFPGTYNPPKAC